MAVILVFKVSFAQNKCRYKCEFLIIVHLVTGEDMLVV